MKTPVQAERWTRLALVLWLVGVVAVTAPFTSWQGHSHWYLLHWIPFTDVVRPHDLVLNMILYAPLGLLALRNAGRRQRLLGSALAAVLVSLPLEISQVYSHGRFASSTDLCMNVLGAVLGSASASRTRSPVDR